MINYFTLFNLEPVYFIDKDGLEMQYFQLQMQFHPDRVAGKNEDEKILILRKSADINEGYRVLLDDVARAENLLELNGIRVNKENNNSFNPAPDLLEEQMELREQAALQMDKKDLLTLVDISFGKAKADFDGLYAEKNYEKAAQEAMRLKYLSKLKEELERNI